jgi:hypothetical protein
MKINSRAKGANGEREFAKEIESLIGVKLTRNLEQTRGGGHDLVIKDASTAVDKVLDRFAIEIKRYATVSEANIKNFWVQASEQASKVDKIPVLAVRENGKKWKVYLHLNQLNYIFPEHDGVEWLSQISLTSFCHLIRYSALSYAMEEENLREAC